MLATNLKCLEAQQNHRSTSKLKQNLDKKNYSSQYTFRFYQMKCHFAPTSAIKLPISRCLPTISIDIFYLTCVPDMAAVGKNYL